MCVSNVFDVHLIRLARYVALSPHLIFNGFLLLSICVTALIPLLFLSFADSHGHELFQHLAGPPLEFTLPFRGDVDQPGGSLLWRHLLCTTTVTLNMQHISPMFLKSLVSDNCF